MSIWSAVQRESSPGTEVSTTTPPGYRQSEIGLFPDDWEITTLGALGRPLSGGTPRSSDTRFWGGEIPWISSKDMKVSRLNDSIDHVTPLALGNGTRLVQPGTILMVVRGMSLAQSFPVAIVEKPVAFNQDLKAFVPNADVDGEFVLRWLEFNQAVLLLLATEATHGTKRIPTPDLLASRVPLPRPAEQRAIAQALSDVHDLLEAVDALIEKREAIKQAVIQQLLTGRIRLPEFSREWTMKRIGDFADCTAGGTPSTFVSEYWGGAIRWMNSGELNNRVIHDVEGRITERGMRESSTKCVPPGSVLVGLAGQGKTRGTTAISQVGLCINQSIAAILPNSSFVPEYVFHNLDSRYGELREMSTGGGGRGALNLEIIRSILMPFPDVGEQHAISTVLSDMDAEIAALERRRDKVRAIKQGMMEQLLTGRVRVV